MEPIGSHQVVAYFLAALPDELLHAATVAICRAYPEAFDASRAQFSEPVAHDYVGHRRRAIIENAFGALAARSDATVDYVPNVTGGANHIEIARGNVVLTESKTDHPRAAIHDARFRATLAGRADPGLWYSDSPLDDGTPLWAAIVHGPGGPRDRTPGFIRVVFPDASGHHAGFPSIDLYRRYPDLRPGFEDLPAMVDEVGPRLLPWVVRTIEPAGEETE